MCVCGLPVRKSHPSDVTNKQTTPPAGDEASNPSNHDISDLDSAYGEIPDDEVRFLGFDDEN